MHRRKVGGIDVKLQQLWIKKHSIVRVTAVGEAGISYKLVTAAPSEESYVTYEKMRTEKWALYADDAFKKVTVEDHIKFLRACSSMLEVELENAKNLSLESIRRGVVNEKASAAVQRLDIKTEVVEEVQELLRRFLIIPNTKE